VTDAGGRGRVRLGELADAALADAEPVAHAGFVADLAAVTRTADAVTAVADRLLAGGGRGRRVFLEWVARLPVRLPAPLLDVVPPLLTDPSLPDDLRARAAARALRSTRDVKDYLPRFVSTLTTGVSPLVALARLRAVQSRLRRSAALDAVIARRERRLRLACPHCGTRMRRPELAAHLFAAHGLILDDGRARRPDTLAKHLRRHYAAARDTTVLDRAATLADPASMRAWAARTGAAPTDLAPLADAARATGNGLCPRCLAEVTPSVDPLPAPLTLAGGRLAGDGYVVEVCGPDGLRTCTVATPAGVLRSGLDGRRAVGPRAAGVLAAAAVLLFGLGLRAPPAWAIPAAAAAYLVARVLRPPLPPPADRAVDRAWTTVVPRVPVPDRFLVRLCRASVGRGDPEARAGELAAVAGATDSPEVRAAVAFLQADDAGAFGVDRVATVADLIATGLRDAESVAAAERVAELFLAGAPTPVERARLRVLALDAAFAAGFAPRRLAEAWAGCPRLRDLTAAAPLSRLALQFAVWQLGDDRPWEPGVSAGTVFELARIAPTLGGRLLSEHPDLLLYSRAPPGVDDAIGWVLVTARGVVVGGKTVADPDAEISVRGGRLIGAATLAFGPHRISLPRRPPTEFVATLRKLLVLRAEVLLPRLDAALAPGVRPAGMGGLVRRCGCGAGVVAAAGEVGKVVSAKPRPAQARAGR
jgi:hypothetical protein